MLIYFLYALTGLAAGALAGLFGIGGGVIVVPALAAIFALHGFSNNILMHLAIGTSLAAMISTAISSVYSHHRRGVVNWPLFWHMLPGIIIGTIIGALIASVLNTAVLSIIFAIFLIFIALRIFFAASHAEATRQLPHSFGQILMGLSIGIAAGLLGIGGGSIAIPLLTYFGATLATASGVSAGLTLPIAITGTISVIFTGWHATSLHDGTTGYIFWPAAILIGIFSVIGVPFGGKLAKTLPVPTLKQIFAILLLLTAIELIWPQLKQLWAIFF